MSTSLITTLDINMLTTPKEILDQFLALGRIRKYLNINGITYQLNIDEEVRELLTTKKRIARLEKRREYYKLNKDTIYNRSIDYYRKNVIPNLKVQEETLNALTPQVVP
jgi:hypothetical protein